MTPIDQSVGVTLLFIDRANLPVTSAFARSARLTVILA